jgi:diacylglycerol kinase (ATP)
VNKKKITFIVNPISGTGKQKHIDEAIRKNLDHGLFDHEIFFTSGRNHATALAEEAVKTSDIIAAVGGDGTINEVAKVLIGKAMPMAVIPTGSGNGFASHYKIPCEINAAIRLLGNAKVIATDTAQINGIPYLSTAGMGFDAHIAEKFNKSAKRGLASYARLVLTEWVNFQPLKFSFSVDGNKSEREAFLMTVANCTQFGNNALIAPLACSDDGKINITLVRPFPFWAVPGLLYRLFSGSMHRSPYVDTFEGAEINVEQSADCVHYDGEFSTLGKIITFKVVPHSLNLLVP